MATRAAIKGKQKALPLGYETVDADGHTTVPIGEWWKPYLEKRYWDWAPRYAQENGKRGVLLAEGRAVGLSHPLPGNVKSGDVGSLMTPGGWRNKNIASVTAEQARKTGGALPKDRLASMDKDGVDISYMYPSEMLSLPWAVTSSSFAIAIAKAYNDWLADYCKTDPHRLRGAAIIPQQDLILAAEETQRSVKKGLKTIMLRPNVIAGQSLDHPNYDRLWEVCQDLNIGVGIHEGFGEMVPRMGTDRARNWMQMHAFEHPAEHMMSSMLMLFDGVFERFPKLRVGFLENGAGWAGFWLHHLDEHWEKWHTFYPGIKEKPSYYFKRNCYLGIEPDYDLLPHLVECGLEDTLVFSTDFPHFDAIFPGSVSALVNRKDVSAATKRKALHDNCLRLYTGKPK